MRSTMPRDRYGVREVFRANSLLLLIRRDKYRIPSLSILRLLCHCTSVNAEMIDMIELCHAPAIT